MPLIKSGSKSAVSENIKREMASGKKQSQAVAIALSVARRAHKDDGGPVSSPYYDQANTSMQMTPQEQALYQRHLTNLNGAGGVDNPDGSRSTLYQSVQEHNGKYYNVPTVWDGQIQTQKYTNPQTGQTFDVPNQTAIDNINKAGWDSFPSYSTPDEADSRYGKMHDYMEKDTEDYLAGRPDLTKKRGGSIARALNISRKANGGGVFSGYIPGTTGGRTDNKEIHVADGAYVIPADILSGLGEGNSHAGAAALHRQFGMDIPTKADGGAIGQPIPIVAASGEMVVPPEKVAQIGGGDIERGHGILDALVKHVRSRTIKKLKSLPKPRRN